jgi:hypothetical protein
MIVDSYDEQMWKTLVLDFYWLHNSW